MAATEDIAFTPFDSFASYSRYLADFEHLQTRRREIERSLLSAGESFEIEGYCRVCDARRRFQVDYRYAYAVDGVLTPNWRERLTCSGCGLNNRTRAAIHRLLAACRPGAGRRLYITEQTTPLYRWLTDRFDDVTGSEYLGAAVPLGAATANGLRNEDLTRLSFVDGTFDVILSFDVLEHVPAYREALAEVHRCLRPGGVFLFSAPFRPDCEKNLVRARLGPDGEVRHLLPPENHADPIDPAGCLCFYHFGWQLLEDARAAGFTSVTAYAYWSREFGYLGRDQMLFQAAVPSGSSR